MNPKKENVISAFIREFERESEVISASAQAAHEAATHEESKSEDQHDTRGLEASYLAGAQASRLAVLKQTILEFRRMAEERELKMETVAAGALVTIQPLVDVDSETPKGPLLHSLIAVHGGGVQVEVDGISYSILTPTSPLGEAILGGSSGETVEIESKGGVRAYRVISVE